MNMLKEKMTHKILILIMMSLVLMSTVFADNTTLNHTEYSFNDDGLFSIDTNDYFILLMLILVYISTFVLGLKYSMIPFSIVNLVYSLISYANTSSVILSLLFIILFVLSIVFNPNTNTGITT